MDADHRGTILAFMAGHDPIRAVRAWLAMAGVPETAERKAVRRAVREWQLGETDTWLVERLLEIANENVEVTS